MLLVRFNSRCDFHIPRPHHVNLKCCAYQNQVAIKETSVAWKNNLDPYHQKQNIFEYSFPTQTFILLFILRTK
jgi:hypothetical protein